MADEPAARTDDKAGQCSRCRQGDHDLCASPVGRCSCTGRRHPNRPSARSQETAVPASAARQITAVPDDDPLADVRARAGVSEVCGACRRSQHTNCTKPSCACPFERHANRRSANGRVAESSKLSEPVWELVKADPPAPPPKPKKLTAIEKARPLLEEVMAEGSKDWHRIAIFPSSMAAGQTKGRLVKAYREFEFQAVRVPEISQSAIYVKWTGAKPGPLA